MRQGDNAALAVYNIISIGEEQEYGYIPVKAQQIKTGGWKNYMNKPSILHGELFPHRAMLVIPLFKEQEDEVQA